MGRYLDIANKALESIEEQSKTGCSPITSVATQYEKNEFYEKSSDAQTIAELERIVAMRERGLIPDHYTRITNCRHCGPVPIFEGCPPEVLGCPWCFNRLKGLPIPRI